MTTTTTATAAAAAKMPSSSSCRTTLSTIRNVFWTYVTLVLRLSFGLWDLLALDFVIGFSLRGGGGRERQDTTTATVTTTTAEPQPELTKFRLVRPIFRRDGSSLKDMMCIREKYLETSQVLLDQELRVKEVDSDSLCLSSEGDSKVIVGSLQALEVWASYVSATMENLKVFLVSSKSQRSYSEALLIESIASTPGTEVVTWVDGADVASEKLVGDRLSDIVALLCVREVARSCYNCSKVVLHLPALHEQHQDDEEYLAEKIQEWLPGSKRLFFNCSSARAIEWSPARLRTIHPSDILDD